MTQTELDQALAQLADEVPPMPADFHEKWMNAVRADGRRGPAEEKTENRTVSLVRWTRILSIAAAFIFLIGGTVIYRNSKKTPATAFRSEKKAAPQLAAGAPEAGDAAVYEEELPAEEAMAAGAATEAAEEADFAAPVLFMNAEKGTEGAGANEAAPEAVPADPAGSEAEEAAEEEAAEAEAAVEAVETALPAEAPEEAAEPRTGFLQEAGAFFTDMGGFLLAALPYLAVLAVPAVTALVLRRRKR